MKKCGIFVIATVFFMLAPAVPTFAADVGGDDLIDLGEITVTAEKEKAVEFAPNATVINVEKMDEELPGEPQNVLDYIRDVAGVYVEDEGDETAPGEDALRIRGMSFSRSAIAVNGMQVRRSGGRGGSNTYDFNLYTADNVERIEVYRGPHSALFPGESLAGALNIVMKTPRKRTALLESGEIQLNVSDYDIGDYNTKSNKYSIVGGAGSFVYDLSLQDYLSDGFLKGKHADNRSSSSKASYIFSDDGWISYTYKDARVARGRYSTNEPGNQYVDYDPGFPIYPPSYTRGNTYKYYNYTANQYSHEVDADWNTGLGRWNLGFIRDFQGKVQDYEYVKPNGQSSSRLRQPCYDMIGGKVQNRFSPHKKHTVTVGYDWMYLYSSEGARGKGPRRKSFFFQDTWRFGSRFDATLGARHEEVVVETSNSDSRGYYPGQKVFPGLPDEITKKWSGWAAPKIYLNYRLSPENTVSLGASRIYKAPSGHNDFGSQGWPGQKTPGLKAERGTAYDIAFMRQVRNTTNVRLGFFHYDHEDYITTNRDEDYLAELCPVCEFPDVAPGEPDPACDSDNPRDYAPNCFHTYCSVNIGRVDRKGMEIEMSGRLSDRVSAALTHTYQKVRIKSSEYKTDEAYGNLYGQPKNLFTLTTNFQMTPETGFTLRHTRIGSKKTSPSADKNPSYTVTDFSIFRKFPERNMFLKLYVDNMFNSKKGSNSTTPRQKRLYGTTATYLF